MRALWLFLALTACTPAIFQIHPPEPFGRRWRKSFGSNRQTSNRRLPVASVYG